MDDIQRAITLAFIALVGALVTQIFLRWDQTRRDHRLRLLSDLRTEQQLVEGIAYRARKLILKHADEIRVNRSEIEPELFERVYEQSSLVTLTAELDAFGICVGDYSASNHRYRGRCKDIVEAAIASGADEDAPSYNEYLGEVQCEVKHVTAAEKRRPRAEI